MKAHNIVGFALMAFSFLALRTMEAQTVISNETLVTTTFVVNKQSATAKCGKSGCRAMTSMIGPIAVTCPAPIGQTCTFHIALDGKISTEYRFGQPPTMGPAGFYQFLVDSAAPTIGPTDKDGNYLFEKNVLTTGEFVSSSRQSYPASVLASVTNSGSSSHTIAVNVGCADTNGFAGCATTAHWSTMRVDVFEP